jgi:hypothetical protein
MGDHVVRRGPPTSPPQPTGPRHPTERRSTTESPGQQLHALIPDPTHGDREAELDLFDALPDVLLEGTPDSLPSMSSPRLAYSLRRGMQSGTVPITPARPAPTADRADISTVSVSGLEHSVTAAAEPSPARNSDLLDTWRSPRAQRAAMPALASSQADVGSRMTDREAQPADAAGTPRRSFLLDAGRARLVPIMLLVLALGAVAIWLLRAMR